MVNVRLGDKTYTGVTAVKTDTTDGGTAEFAPYDETFAAGKAEGIEEGYANGKTDGIAEGVRSEYDRLWDGLQLNGTRREYSEAFGSVWSAETFRPKYDLMCAGAYSMFANFSYNQPINLKQVLVDAGVQLLFPNSHNINGLFQSSAVTHLGEIDFSTVTRKNCVSIFYSCSHLVSIDKLVLPIGQTTFAEWFNGCTALEHITIEGEIGADINFGLSPLSAASITSVITHLSDTTTGKAASFSLSVVNAAFETEQGAADGSTSQAWLDLVATKSNWTISLV